MFGLKRRSPAQEQSIAQNVDGILPHLDAEVAGMTAAMTIRLHDKPVRATFFAAQAAPLLATYSSTRSDLLAARSLLDGVSEAERMDAEMMAMDCMAELIDVKQRYDDLAGQHF